MRRDKSTIGRELKRNQTKLWTGKSDELVYEPNHAHFMTEERKQKAFGAKQRVRKTSFGVVTIHTK